MNGIRWGNLVKVTNDKGPYKLAKFKADNHEVVGQIVDSYGIQGSPPEGSQALLIPVDDDEGKFVAIVMPPPKSRETGLKAGEVKLKNHTAGQSIFMDETGNTTVDMSGKHIETIGGDRTETIGGTVRTTTGGVWFVNC